MSEYILSIDAGTTSSRAIIFDKKGKTIGVSQHEFTQFFPKQGWVEHDALEIWNTQLKAIKEVLQKTNIDASQINALGITNQRETTLLWDRNTGIPVHKAIVWQDRRTANICNSILKKGKADLFYEKTGLILDSYFSGTKIKWILDQDPDLRKKAENGEIIFGTIDSWLIWNLTGRKVHVTDVTNASRTLLFNIHSLKWDSELLEILDIPKKILPKIVSCSEKIAYTEKGLFEDKILISGIAGDQQAALFGQMCINPGDVKNTYGTGCFCIMNTGDKPVKSKNKMLTTIGYRINNKTYYALEGSVFVAGAAVQWLRDQLGIISSASEIESLAKTVKNSGGVTFIPALAGLAAPYWDPHATGTIMGITRGTQKGHIARATLEAIAMRTKEIITAMEKDAKFKFKSLKVDGGASNNSLLMQIQSNLLGVNVIRPKTTETTALGAAFFAGLASGFWASLEKLSSVWDIDTEFSPIENEETLSIINNWEKRILKMSNSQNHE
ncbi:MAG: glycerol kinase GlpK [Bacteroidota bacterium]|nr:glycerol kinase GlpK [Bacteroidota bacterium]